MHAGATRKEANARLNSTVTQDKNEILFSEFGMNYNDLPVAHRKGSVLVRRVRPVQAKLDASGSPVMRDRAVVDVLHCDIIRDDFWESNPHILAGGTSAGPVPVAR